MGSRSVLWVALAAALGVGVVQLGGCDAGGNSSSGLSGGKGSGASTGTDTGGSNTGGDETSFASMTQPSCEGLECDVPACGSTDGTTITGSTYAPNGTLPLYNVVVYIPKYPEQELEPITTGATCEQCPTTIPGVVATALSDSQGKFKLTNVPAGTNIPLVVQIGKWRRVVTLPPIQPCVENPLSDPELTRLPKSQTEGDLPQMNIVTGGCDPLPCLFRKMGLADTEFTDSTQGGRMHVFQGDGGVGVDGGSAQQPQNSLWSSVATLMPYDITLLSCECDEYNQYKTDLQKGYMRDYLNAGGRVFATHYHYTWFKNGPPEFQTIATWTPATFSFSPFTINTGFPKGQAFAEWLGSVGSVAGDQINLIETRDDLTSIGPNATSWIYKPVGSEPESVKYFSFNTPVGLMPEEQCGRAVFSDIHVSADYIIGNVPSGCGSQPLTDQEKALIFLFFDLAACLTPDDEPPEPPIPD